MKLFRFKKLKVSKAFTLVELLVVVSILGILGTVIIRVLSPDAHKKNAEDAVTRVQLENLSAAILSYRELEGRLPTASNGDPTGESIDDYITNWPDDFVYYPLDDEDFVIEAESADYTPDEPDYLVYHSGNEDISGCAETPCYDPEGGESGEVVDFGTSCTDTDGGTDAFVAGTVTYLSENYSDTCENSDTVKEYYCNTDASNVGEVSIPCTYGCESNACLATDPTPPPVCNDSDGGNKPYIYGELTYGEITRQDVCAEVGSGVLENYCSSGVPAVDKVYCPGGCSDGACEAEVVPAEDLYECTIGGLNCIMLSGDSLTQFRCDTCDSTTTLKHYTCPDVTGLVTMQQVEDAATYSICADGSCIKNRCVSSGTASCTDTDGGIVIGRAGSVTAGGITKRDLCKGESIVEYYCSSPNATTASSVTQYCANCISGACRESILPGIPGIPGILGLF